MKNLILFLLFFHVQNLVFGQYPYNADSSIYRTNAVKSVTRFFFDDSNIKKYGFVQWEYNLNGKLIKQKQINSIENEDFEVKKDFFYTNDRLDSMLANEISRQNPSSKRFAKGYFLYDNKNNLLETIIADSEFDTIHYRYMYIDSNLKYLHSTAKYAGKISFIDTIFYENGIARKQIRMNIDTDGLVSEKTETYNDSTGKIHAGYCYKSKNNTWIIKSNTIYTYSNKNLTNSSEIFLSQNDKIDYFDHYCHYNKKGLLSRVDNFENGKLKDYYIFEYEYHPKKKKR